MTTTPTLITRHDSEAERNYPPTPTLPRNLKELRPEHVTKAIEYTREYGASKEMMQQISTCIDHLLVEFSKRKDRYSDNTIDQLKTNWGLFVEWCADNSHNSLPATAEVLEEFLSNKSKQIHRNSIKSYIWAISKMHRITGCPDPMTDEILRDKYVGIIRSKAKKGERIRQATAFRERHLDQITEYWRKSPSLKDRRNLAVLTLGYESMLRISEIANIRFQDIEFIGDGTAILTIPITKTNHSGEPDTVLLSEIAVSILVEYIEMSKLDITISESFVFTSLTKHNRAIKQILRTNKKTGEKDYRKLTTRQMEETFYECWEVLGLESVGISRFSGHSARVGACQDLLEDGYTVLQVQQAGRWSSPQMVLRYGRNILARESAMARKRANRRY